MSKLYLARLDYEQNGHLVMAIRAVRMIRSETNGDAGFKAATELVDTLVNDPTEMVLVTEHEDTALLHELVLKAADFHGGAAEFAVDPESTTMESPDAAEVTAGEFSAAAYRTALLLVNMHSDPTAAYVAAWQLSRATEDESLFQEVQGVLLEVFQIEVGPQGPQVHIL